MLTRLSRTSRVALLVSTLALSWTVSPAASQARSQTFTLADGRVSFVAPPGFTEMSAELLARKYPRGGAPRHAISNAQTTTSIAFDLADLRVPSSDLERLRKALMQGIAALPKLKWVANDVRKIVNRDWAYLEFTAAAADQDIHNIILASVYDGRLLMFNFNSTVAEFPKLEAALRASMATITARP